jgi:hypothetical protein
MASVFRLYGCSAISVLGDFIREPSTGSLKTETTTCLRAASPWVRVSGILLIWSVNQGPRPRFQRWWSRVVDYLSWINESNKTVNLITNTRERRYQLLNCQAIMQKYDFIISSNYFYYDYWYSPLDGGNVQTSGACCAHKLLRQTD